ncbi:MAG TPA: phosphoethanolamine transferase, partial [Reyranella sp.]|nr:phosphoethanolamine transferase [Reyranella sp.]
RIDRTPNIIPLENMVTQEALTQVSVPLMITRGSIDHPRPNEKSIVSTFKEAGFRTFWLSTQQVDHWTAPISRYSSEADHVAFYERRYDMVLVDALRDILGSTSRQNGKQKLFLVLHTDGSHFVYKDRYPWTTAPFKAIGSEKEKIIAEYDNSVEYTDQVLSRIISTLSGYHGLTALLYVSDHGENLYDDSRMLLGHFFENEYDIPIPAFLWTSQAYAEQHPELVEAAKRNAVRPLNTRVVFSTLAQMAGIEIPGMDVGKLSMLSNHLQPGPRLFYKQGTIMNYDTWAGSSGLHGQAEHEHASK